MLYQVQYGDSPATIAARFGITMAQMLAANPQKPTTWVNGIQTFISLAPGETISVPASGVPTPPVVPQTPSPPSPYSWDGARWQLRHDWRERQLAWQQQQAAAVPQQPVFPQFGAPNPFAWNGRQWVPRQQMPSMPAAYRPAAPYGGYNPYGRTVVVHPPMGRRF
jgi:hypothetical protein